MKREAWASPTTVTSGFVCWPCTMPVSRHSYEEPNFFTGLSLYAILFCCAPLIARFYHQPALTGLARFLFLSFLISSLGTAHNARLVKQLKVKQNAIIGMCSLLLSGVVGVVLASQGMAYWGLAVQSIVYITLVMTGRWMASGWRPSLDIDFRPLRKLMNFSIKVLASNIINHINANVLMVIMGRFYTPHDVGNYSQASKWNTMGTTLIQGMIGSVAQPVLKEASVSPARLERTFRKLLRFASFVSMPCMFGLSLIAGEFITIAITAKWAESSVLLSILCIGGAFLPIQNLMSTLLLSQSRSDIVLWNTIAFGLFQILTELVCYRYGILLMVWAFVAVNILWLFVWWYFIWRTTRISGWKLLKDVAPFCLLAGVTMVCAYFLASYFSNIYMSLAVKILSAVAIYTVLVYLSGAKTFRDAVHFLLHHKF